MTEIERLQLKETAALNFFGGRLGNCYIMAEIIEALMIDTLSSLKTTKWYRHEIKKYFKKAKELIHTTIGNSVRNSVSSADYMREMADAVYEILKPDLFKFKNAIYLELSKNKVTDASLVADVVVIDTLLSYVNLEYSSTLSFVKKKFPGYYYDTWYHPAKCEEPKLWWNKGVKLFSSKYLKTFVDLNTSTAVKNGIDIIRQRMDSEEVSEAARQEALKYAEDNSGREVYDEALKTLGLI